MGSPERTVKKILRDHDITSPPIDLNRILRELGIIYEEGKLPKDIQGAFIPENPPIIVISNTINNDGLKRFSLAHELGHYFLPGHCQSFSGTHFSKKTFARAQEIEREADLFAAYLLMPATLFCEHFDKEAASIESIIQCSKKFMTSITSTAIRAANVSGQVLAVVMSSEGKIEFKHHTESLADFIKKLGFSKSTMGIPEGNPTSKLNATAHGETQAGQLTGISILSDWYDCEFDIQLREEAIHLGEYNKIITLLSIGNDLDEILENLRENETWRPKYDMN